MAQVRLQYTIPGAGASTGAQVDITITYDENAPVAGQPANTFLATGATGVYRVLDGNQNVIRTDTVTGIGAPGNPSTGNANNFLAIGNVGTSTPIVVGSDGLNITKNNTANSSYTVGGVGTVNIFRQGSSYTQDVEAPRSSTSSSSAIVCFAAGTLIRTVHGDVAVECLAVGDRVVTSSGEERPIRWVGSRTLDLRWYPDKAGALPVRIRANAIGDGLPARDLVVSPGHAIAIDILGEVLIPATSLINGSTIVQEEVDRITYWHVELETHDVLVAEAQPAESYLDIGNRSFFETVEDRGSVIDLSGDPDGDPRARTHADYCRPYHDQGPIVDAIRLRLQARAEALGWRRVTPDAWAGVHLQIDGEIVQPRTRGDSASFQIPREAQDITLVCPTGIPRLVSYSHDGRNLGLSLGRVRLVDGFGDTQDVSLDDPNFSDGFHEVSVGHRWTMGQARLPAALFGQMEGPLLLRLDLAGPRVAHWVAPETRVDAGFIEEITRRSAS